MKVILFNNASTYLWKHIATAVENGKKALEELKNENNVYDLLLLDLNMPVMDGFELLSIMQDDTRLKEIPVVIMSANDSKEIIANCLSKL